MQKVASKDVKTAMKYITGAGCCQAIDLLQRNGHGIRVVNHPSTKYCGDQAELLLNPQGPFLSSVNNQWRKLHAEQKFSVNAPGPNHVIPIEQSEGESAYPQKSVAIGNRLQNPEPHELSCYHQSDQALHKNMVCS